MNPSDPLLPGKTAAEAEEVGAGVGTPELSDVQAHSEPEDSAAETPAAAVPAQADSDAEAEIGRASCRERV